MSDKINYTIRMERELRDGFKALCAEAGVQPSLLFSLFARKTVGDGRLPLRLDFGGENPGAAENPPSLEDLEERALGICAAFPASETLLGCSVLEAGGSRFLLGASGYGDGFRAGELDSSGNGYLYETDGKGKYVRHACAGGKKADGALVGKDGFLEAAGGVVASAAEALGRLAAGAVSERIRAGGAFLDSGGLSLSGGRDINSVWFREDHRNMAGETVFSVLWKAAGSGKNMRFFRTGSSGPAAEAAPEEFAGAAARFLKNTEKKDKGAE